MTKEIKKIKSGRTFLIIFSIIFIVITLFIFFIGKKLDTPPKVSAVEDIQVVNDFKYFIDFETDKYLGPNSLLTSTKALSGKQCGLIDKNGKYGPAVIIPVPTNDTSEISDIIVKFWLNPSTPGIDVAMAFSIVDQNNNQVHWEGYPVKGNSFAIDNWYSFTCRFKYPKEFINTTYSLKLYLMSNNKDYTPVYIDDVSVSLKENADNGSPRSKLIDFEESNDKRISSKYAKSGYYSTYAKGENGFSESVIIPFKDLDISNINSVSLSFNYLSETSDLNAVFVVSVCDSTSKDLLWQGIDLSKADFKEKVWETANGSILIPEEIAKPENSLKIYLWNRNENQVFLDDVYIVIKENSKTNDSVQPAFDLIGQKKFQPGANRPPYNSYVVNLQKADAESVVSLNKIFTRKSRILTGKFDESTGKDQIFYEESGKYNILYLENGSVVSKEVSFHPAISKDSRLFADKEFLFSINPVDGLICVHKYQANQNKFIETGRIKCSGVDKVIAVTANPDNSFSVFENDGNILTYALKSGSYAQVSGNKPVNPYQGNLKFLKADFFGINKEDVLLIYLEKSQDKYVLLTYNAGIKGWALSDKYKGNSVQSYDQLDFASDYSVIDYDKTGEKELLQLNKTKRFDLRIINFDIMTYNILFNVEFKGFPKKQNPKYYEVSKIICGDFSGDGCSEIIIFQDNISKVDWLTQKTEMYSFSK